MAWWKRPAYRTQPDPGPECEPSPDPPGTADCIRSTGPSCLVDRRVLSLIGCASPTGSPSSSFWLVQEDRGHRSDPDHLWLPLFHPPLAGLALLGLHLDLRDLQGLSVPQARCPPSYLLVPPGRFLPRRRHLQADQESQEVLEGPVLREDNRGRGRHVPSPPLDP